VRKNLETTYYYLETNGELATLDSTIRIEEENGSYTVA
jgi:hypothetical protein